eukprot:5717075-Amphidinium_carterae.1
MPQSCHAVLNDLLQDFMFEEHTVVVQVQAGTLSVRLIFPHESDENKTTTAALSFISPYPAQCFFAGLCYANFCYFGTVLDSPCTCKDGQEMSAMCSWSAFCGD